MKVSIVVPIYNGEKYLKDCLNSLVNQTLEEIEIILVDDNSTDKSKDIIDEFQTKYPEKIKVIHNSSNKGQGYSRNLGIKMALGEYIGFVDCDDYVHKDMYKTMYLGAIQHDYPEVITTGLIFVKDDYYLKNNYNGRRDSGTVYRVLDEPDLILNQSPSACNKLFRKDTLKEGLFLEGKMWEDVGFSFVKLFNAERILCFNNSDYYYRKSSTEGVSAQGFKPNDKLFDIFSIADQIGEELSKSNRYDLLKPQISFIQIASCLQRASEVMHWDIEPDYKDYLCKLISEKVVEKYGDWQQIPIELLSTKVGFLELEYLKKLVNRKVSL